MLAKLPEAGVPFQIKRVANSNQAKGASHSVRNGKTCNEAPASVEKDSLS